MLDRSRRALLALDNLRLGKDIKVLNVSDDAKKAAELEKVGGKDQAPCLVL